MSVDSSCRDSRAATAKQLTSFFWRQLKCGRSLPSRLQQGTEDRERIIIIVIVVVIIISIIIFIVIIIISSSIVSIIFISLTILTKVCVHVYDLGASERISLLNSAWRAERSQLYQEQLCKPLESIL